MHLVQLKNLLISTEQDLINVFGKPLSTDAQYEYWMSASSYLSYGGVLKVVRADGTTLNNANAGVGMASTTIKIKNFDDYEANYSDTEPNYVFAAKNPGSWANELKVCVIDGAADQRIGITTTNPGAAGATIGVAVTTALTNAVIPGVGGTSGFTGFIKGIITGVGTASTTGNSTFDVKILSRVSTATTDLDVEYPITYSEGNANAEFQVSDTIGFINNSGISTGNGSVTTVASKKDWYGEQTLGLTNSVVYWKTIAPKPVTTGFANARNGKNDALHVVVVDDTGSVTGIQGNLLEKHVNLSKALDSVSDVDAPTKNWWKNYLAVYSENVYVGDNPSASNDTFNNTTPLATGFSSGYTAITEAAGLWNQKAQGVTFSALGNVTYTFKGGVDYSALNGMTATLGNLKTSYELSLIHI